MSLYAQAPVFVPKNQYPPPITTVPSAAPPQYSVFWDKNARCNDGFESSDFIKPNKRGPINGSGKKPGQGQKKSNNKRGNKQNPENPKWALPLETITSGEERSTYKMNTDTNANDPHFRSLTCYSPNNSEASSQISKRSSIAKSTRARTISGSTATSIDIRPIPSPPNNSIQFHPSRWKTELCRQFEEQGTCEYGARCLFAHGKHELRELPYRHPKFKTQMCNSFNVQGFCSFGPRCSFIHKKPDAQQLLEELMNNAKSARQPMPENTKGVIHPNDVLDAEGLKRYDKELEKGLLHPDSFFRDLNLLPIYYGNMPERRLKIFIDLAPIE